MKKKVLTLILCVLAAVAMLAGITAVEHFRYCPRESLGFGTYTNPKLEQLNESLDYTVYSSTLMTIRSGTGGVPSSPI